MTGPVVLAGLAGALAPWAMAELAAASSGRRDRSRLGGRPRVARARPALGVSAVGVLTHLGRRLGVAPAPADLARRLAAAGAPAGLRPADVMAVRTGAALVAGLAVLGPASVLPGRLGPFVLVAAPLAAAYAPDLWMARRVRTRARLLRAEAADVLDLLRVCVEAGRAPAAALAEVGRRHRGLLGRELRRAAQELALGRSRALVYEALGQRCPIEELAGLVTALTRADRHGAPLAPALAALATDARAARGRAVREHAARAAPKIQLVVALLLVPAVMLLVAAALAAAFGLA